MFDPTTVRLLPTELLTVFDVVFVAINPTSPIVTTSQIDSLVAHYLLPSGVQAIGVINEKLRIRLGYPLTNFWSKSRPIISSEQYLYWETDVPYVYEEPVYERDNNGNIIINNDNGVITYNILHHAGDVAKDPITDEVIFLHRKGDVKLDENGNPILVSPREVLMETTLFLIDGIYYYANNPETEQYKSFIPRSIVNWLETDIDYYNKVKLEQTEIFLYPKNTLGTIRVIDEEGNISNIDANQHFVVTLYVSESVYLDSELRLELDKMTKETFATLLRNKTVSLTDMHDALKETLEEHIYGANIIGLGGTRQLKAFTIIDDSTEAVIAQKMVLDENGYFNVVDDFVVNYVKHTRI